MGNQSSRGALTQPPPNWTQSFPRETKKLRKYGATADTKVLPQRIPGQRLRPTENGLHLQTKGTITGRRMSEFQVPHHPAFPPPIALHQPHSASMTTLHFPQYQDDRAASMHDLRFGRPPSKSYASEPDLRGPSPPSVGAPPPHTIISQSPTKGRIKSKKKYKAPPVPHPGPHDTQSLPRSVERSHSVGSMMPHQNHHQPTPCAVHFAEHPVQLPPQKPKSRKIGLFRKKNESRQPDQTQQTSPREEKGKKRAGIMVEDKRVAVTPIRYSPREELRERARSLDCLQHELRHSPVSPVPMAASSLTHLDQPHETRLWATLERESRRSVRQEVDPKRSSTIERESRRSYKENRTTSTLERDVQKSHRRMSTLERKVEERKHSQEARDSSTPSSGRHVSRLDSYRDNSSHRRTSSSGSHHELIPEEAERHGEEWKRGENKKIDNEMNAVRRNVTDEWEKADTQVTQRKRMNANLQAELIQTVNNLKKAPADEKTTTLTRKNRESERRTNRSPARPSNQKEEAEQSDLQPKTFFFGMEPQQASRNSQSAANSGLHKIKNQEEAAKTRNREEVHINGLSVEYSRRTLERSDKSRSRSRTAHKETQKSADQTDEPDSRTAAKFSDHQRLSKDVEDFAVAIERRKLRQYDGESGGSGSSRREDGGYHSRQNSGSLYLENEGEGSDENELSMNLRPTLPRRQLEIPRFSPNAAWRSLSLERASREPEALDETHSSEGPDSVFEARIQRFTRPTAPPRGSGEKSADSGISGDAGSPGPNHDFEAMIPTEKSKSSSGPLAVSSPVASGRVEGRRTWTPAQDLDDNSLDSNGEQTVLPAGLSTPPKLTSRSNMFSKPKDIPPEPEDEDDSPIETEPVSELISQDKKDPWRRRKRNGAEIVPQKFNSLRRLKRSVSGAISGLGRKSPEDYDRSRTPDEPRTLPPAPDDSNWRDNWSMSRSIPNSLNTCEEQETASNLSSCRNLRSRSESRMGHGAGGAEGTQDDPRSRTPSYLQYSNGGHIMYLPEYNSRRMSRGEGDSEDEIDRRHLPDQRRSLMPGSPDNERKPPSGDENPVSPERYHGAPSSSSLLHPPPHLLHIPPNSRRLKGKKFSYQSTVRILEKRKLEEKLAREVAEKEMQRLKEMEAMKKVEEEFQRKREREKKKVKQQLKLFQMQQQRKQQCQPSQHPPQGSRDSHNSSYSSDDHALSSYSSEHQEISSQASSPPPPLPASSPPQQVREIFPPFASLPAELPPEPSPGLISGIKSWVRCRKESRSSNSSTTITSSAPRQEPDGAPASSPRKASDDLSSSGTASPSSDPKTQRQQNIRAEIIAASRKRSGDHPQSPGHQHHQQQQQQQLQQQHRASGRSTSSHHARKYDHPEETQQQQQHHHQQQQQETRSDQHESSYHRRQHSNKHLKHVVRQRDDVRRSQSPDGRRVQNVPLIQELSELHQERREYREYRSPSRHSHSPPVRTHNGPPAPIAPSQTSNYRRDFCRGNAQVIGLNLVSSKTTRGDDSDRHSKHSSDGRRSAGGSSVGLGRSSSLDLLDTPSPRPHHRPQHHAQSNQPPDPNLARMSPPVDSSPARFAHSILTPFNLVKGYRPVSFSPPPPTKILHVN